MRLSATILFVLIFQVTFAQTRVIWQKDLKAEGIDHLKITQQYDGPNTGLTQPILDQFQKTMDATFPAVVNPGIVVFAQFYVNVSGAVDYLILDLQAGEGYDMDSLRNHTADSFRKNLESWKLPKAPQKPFLLATLRQVGKPVIRREVKKSDSAVIDMKTAVTIRDTLKIKYLYLNQLDLTELPNVIYRFPNITELHLGGNEFVKANIDLKRFPRLKQLHLQNNQLTNASLALTESSSLRILNLKENKFTDIPDAARKCRKLESLWLGGNALTGLTSKSFKGFKSVRDLNLYRSDITVLPKGIRKMKRLEVLDLYYNKLETLPKTVTRLKRLTHFAVSHNQIAALPNNISRLKKVHTLYAHHNHLSNLPDNIVKMKNLRILDLGYNWFTNFPPELTAFTNLQELDLSSNNFPDFPEQLLKINQLEKLYLRGNPFVTENTEKKYGQQLGLLKSKNIEVFY